MKHAKNFEDGGGNIWWRMVTEIAPNQSSIIQCTMQQSTLIERAIVERHITIKNETWQHTRRSSMTRWCSMVIFCHNLWSASSAHWSKRNAIIITNTIVNNTSNASCQSVATQHNTTINMYATCSNCSRREECNIWWCMVTENLHPTRQVYIFHATITDGDRAAIKRASDEQSGFEAMCWPGTRLSPLLLHACFMAAKLLCSVMSMTAESSYNYGGTQT